MQHIEERTSDLVAGVASPAETQTLQPESSLSSFGDRLRELGFNTYDDYLASPHWREFRLRYHSEHADTSCAVCYSRRVELHHHTYDRLGNEELTDVTPLCRDHHLQVHACLKMHEWLVEKTQEAVALLRAGERFDESLVTGKPAKRSYKRTRMPTDYTAFLADMMIAIARAEKTPLKLPATTSARTSQYPRFVSIAGWLQSLVGLRPIILPVDPVSSVLGVIPMTISRYRCWAIEDGFLRKAKADEFPGEDKTGKATRLVFNVALFPELMEKARSGIADLFRPAESKTATNADYAAIIGEIVTMKAQIKNLEGEVERLRKQVAAKDSESTYPVPLPPDRGPGRVYTVMGERLNGQR